MISPEIPTQNNASTVVQQHEPVSQNTKARNREPLLIEKDILEEYVIFLGKNFYFKNKEAEDLKYNPLDYNEAGMTMIHFSVKHGYIDLLKFLLTQIKPCDQLLTFNQNSLLHIATKYHHPDIVRLLIEFNKIDVYKKNKNGYTPMDLIVPCFYHKVMEEKKEPDFEFSEKIKRCLNTLCPFLELEVQKNVNMSKAENEEYINFRNRGFINMLLFLAIENKNSIKTIKTIIKQIKGKDRNFDMKNTEGKTIFMIAFDSQWKDLKVLLEKLVIDKLLAAEKSFEVEDLYRSLDNKGKSLLDRVVEDDNENFIKKAIQAGLDVNFTSNFAGKSLLLYAVSEDSTNVAHTLLDQGAYPDAIDLTSSTSLIHAVRYRNLYITEMLFSKGANPYKKNDHGETACSIVRNLDRTLGAKKSTFSKGFWEAMDKYDFINQQEKSLNSQM